MQIPRVIPTWVFRIVAVALLAGALVLTIHWIGEDEGLFAILQGELGVGHDGLAGFLTFIVLFVGWCAVVLPLRRVSRLPSKPFGPARWDADAFGLTRKSDSELSVEERRIKHQILATGAGVMGGICLLIAVILSLVFGRVALGAGIFGAVFLVLAVRHALKLFDAVL